MKKLLLIAGLLVLIFASCNPPTNKNYVADKSGVDPVVRQHMIDSMVDNTMKSAYLKDTVGISNAPVKIISARPATKDYSTYKDIRLTYKNVSGKTISAIRFKWYGLNAFGEGADMGGITSGIGAGFSDTKLRAGKTESSTWGILSRDLKKVVIAWPYEVVFEDGSKWSN